MAREDVELRSAGNCSGGAEGAKSAPGPLWEAVRDVCLMLGSDRRILRVNAAGAAALGYEPEEMVGRPWTDFVHPEDVERSAEGAFRAREAAVLRDGVENRWRAADGSDRWMVWTGAIAPDGEIAYAVGKDVSELRRAQAALSEIESGHRTALTGMEEGVVLQDAQGRILLANPAARRILGLGEIVVGRADDDPGWETLRDDGSVLPPGERPVARVLRTGEPQVGVVLGLRWRGGEQRWLRVSARPVEPDADGEPAKVVSSFVDITPLKEAEEHLRRSEARFRSLAASAPIGIFARDAAGEPEFVNDALRRYSDGTSGDSLEWIHAYVHPDDRERIAAAWGTAVREHGEYAQDFRICPSDGEVRWVQARATPLEGGGFVGSFDDVTERVEAEAEARASAARLRAIVDNVGAGIYVKDLEGTYQLINGHAAQVLGRTVEQVVGRCDEDLMPPEVAERLRANDEQVLASGGPMRFEERYARGNGEEGVFLTVKVPLLGEDGRAYAICGMSTDITDRVRAEREREELLGRLARVERLDTVARLVAGITHDFNNLLSIIQNAASVAASREEEDEEEGSFAHEEINAIGEAAARAAELTRRLMLFARRKEPELSPIDLREPLAEIVRTLPTMLGDRFEIRLEADDDLWPALGDRALVEQSLLNLAFNARDAMPEGGLLTISARNLDLAERYRADLPAGRYVSLSVSDTGHGMAPDIASRALEPFFTTKAKGEGTGLGLATVWGTATMAGGTVEVDSACGEGTTIRLFLAAEEKGGPAG